MPRLSAARRRILAHCREHDVDVVLLEPPALDAALVGLSCQQPGRPVCAVYDADRLVDAFIRLGLSPEDAHDQVYGDTLQAWVGETTPIVIYRCFERPACESKYGLCE